MDGPAKDIGCYIRVVMRAGWTDNPCAYVSACLVWLQVLFVNGYIAAGLRVSNVERTPMAINEWIHLEELGSNPWVLPIYNEWNRAAAEKRIAPQSKEVGELGLRITTRLNLIGYVGHRLGNNLADLWNAVARHSTEAHRFTREKEAVALRLDTSLKYLAIADLHSFVSELDACMEGLKKFMHTVHCHVGQPLTKEERIRMLNSWMERRKIDPSWFGELAGCRNFIAHDGAFYLAFDVTDGRRDLLMVKSNVKAFDDPTSYVTFACVDRIRQSFNACLEELQTHLIGLIAQAR